MSSLNLHACAAQVMIPCHCINSVGAILLLQSRLLHACAGSFCSIGGLLHALASSVVLHITSSITDVIIMALLDVRPGCSSSLPQIARCHGHHKRAWSTHMVTGVSLVFPLKKRYTHVYQVGCLPRESKLMLSLCNKCSTYHVCILCYVVRSLLGRVQGSIA